MKLRLLPGILLLSCSLTCSITSQAQTPTKGVYIPEAQAAIIATSLQKFEALKPAYQKLKATSLSKDTTISALKLQGIAKDSALANSQRSYNVERTLRLDSNNKQAVYKAKARRNGLKFWLLLSLNALAACLYLHGR